MMKDKKYHHYQVVGVVSLSFFEAAAVDLEKKDKDFPFRIRPG